PVSLSPVPLVPSSPRLITLTGPGGTGKTRLAQEVGRQLWPALAGAVWFVPLADLSDARLIPDEILDTLYPRSSHPGVLLPRPRSDADSLRPDPLEQVVAGLSQQPSLLILDSFEHLVNEGTSLVLALLERAPRLQVLVTSRQRLDLTGEREFPVPP